MYTQLNLASKVNTNTYKCRIIRVSSKRIVIFESKEAFDRYTEKGRKSPSFILKIFIVFSINDFGYAA